MTSLGVMLQQRRSKGEGIQAVALSFLKKTGYVPNVQLYLRLVMKNVEQILT